MTAEPRVWFEDWRTLDQFTLALGEGVPKNHRSNAQKYWREAWTGARFAKWVRPSCELRLTADGSPLGDLEVRDASGSCGYEIAEALDAAGMAQHNRGNTVVGVSEVELSGDMARSLIPRLINQKAGKGYPPGTSLILYLDVWDDELSLSELPGLVPESPGFPSIWLLNSGGSGVCQIHPTLKTIGSY